MEMGREGMLAVYGIDHDAQVGLQWDGGHRDSDKATV